jgi:hypothetical protein
MYLEPVIVLNGSMDRLSGAYLHRAQVDSRCAKKWGWIVDLIATHFGVDAIGSIGGVFVEKLPFLLMM